jgi:SecD/SecF fusion protein
LFGGATLKDFAFALLIGVASGAYSSIFIASPVLTHWKEREPAYRARRARIETDLGHVPAYATGVADVEPQGARRFGRAGRLTTPEQETVSAAEFEQMKRDLELEPQVPGRRTSTLTKRPARSEQAGTQRAPARAPKPAPPEPTPQDGGDGAHAPAPDIPENEGVAPAPKPKRPPKPRARNRRHGRRR